MKVVQIFIFVVGIFCLWAQAWGVYEGVKVFGKWTNAYLLFAAFVLPVFLFLKNSGDQPALQKLSKSKSLLWACAGMLASLILLGPMIGIFEQYADPAKYSDVVPQIEWLWDRFCEGKLPYVPTETVGHQPFPVYMPIHWYPLFITDIFQIDSRWSGYILIVLASGLLGFLLSQQKLSNVQKTIALLMPHLALWYAIASRESAMPVSFELPIMAYYFVLGLGLYFRKNWIIVIGVFLCVLSRYTLVFWLPLLALLLWKYEEKKWSYLTWGICFALGMVTYVIPYMIAHPNILLDGIHWHNGAAKAEWHGYGNPAISWTQERGVYFAAHFKSLLQDFDNDTQVKYMRMIQASIMIGLLILGGFLDRMKKWHWTQIALAMLYTTLVCFYFFSPLTYRYYYLVPTMLGALIVFDLCRTKGQKEPVSLIH